MFTIKVVERDGGSNPAARPRGRLDAFEARFFGTLLLVRSQHSGSSLVTRPHSAPHRGNFSALFARVAAQERW